MKKISILIILLAFSLLANVSSSAQTEAKVFLNSSECLELENSSMTNSVRVKVAPCSSSALQDFTIEGAGTSGNSVNIKVNSSRCIEILGANTNSGVEVTQWNCDNSPEQTFQLAGNIANLSATRSISGPIRFSHSGQCFDTSQRPFVKQFPCNSLQTQVFEIKSKTITSPPSPTTPSRTEQAFWDLIKDSNDSSDFLSYLTSFPKGAFVPIARLRIKQINRSKTSNPTPPPNPGSPISLILNNDVAVIRRRLPLTVGQVDLTDISSFCRMGCTNFATTDFLTLEGWTPRLTGSQRDAQAQALKPALLVDYCNSGAVQGGMNLKVKISDGNKGTSFADDFSYFITPSDCFGNPNPPPPTTGKDSPDDEFWNKIKDSKRVEDYEVYLQAFPNGKHKADALLTISRLKQGGNGDSNNGNNTQDDDDRFWDKIKGSNLASDFDLYLREFPKGKYRVDALLIKSRLDKNPTPDPKPDPTPETSPDDEFWNKIKNSTRVEDYEVYLQAYPNGKHKADALLNISRLKPKPPPPPDDNDDKKDELTRCTVVTRSGNLNVRSYDGKRIGTLSNGEIVYLNEEEGNRSNVSQRRNGRFVVLGWVVTSYLDCEF